MAEWGLGGGAAAVVVMFYFLTALKHSHRMTMAPSLLFSVNLISAIVIPGQ